MNDMSRDELREDLVAAIEAAAEMPKGDRQHFADVFLDRLNEAYDLSPRGAGGTSRSTGPAGGPPWNRRWVKVALVVAFLIFVLPAVFHHLPFLLLTALAVFLVVKYARSHRWPTAPFA